MIYFKSVFKIILVNIFILISLIIFVELSFALGRLLIGKQVYIPIFKTQSAHFFTRSDIKWDGYTPYHPCIEMKTSVLLSHVPNHRNKCDIKDGKAVGEYVVYDYSLEDNPILLVLGGSTSSGFYQHYAKGNTWPMYLAELISKNYYLVNGGVGGYTSSHEFIKFMRDGSRFKNLKFIISLNGINEFGTYNRDELNTKTRAFEHPYITAIQHDMNKNQKWIEQRFHKNLLIKVYDQFFPNTKSFFDNLSRYANSINKSRLKKLPKKSDSQKVEVVPDWDAIDESKLQKINFFQPIYEADRWEDNINRLNIIAKSKGIKYFVFLQPTLGLIGPQSNPAKGSNDELLYRSLLRGNYLENLNWGYDELKKRCLKIKFCFDITDVAPPTGNMYKDFTHHNSNGNKIIAEEVFNILKKQVDFID